MNKVTPIDIPRDFGSDKNYQRIAWLARIDNMEAEAVLELYSNSSFPDNYILISNGMRYPSHQIIIQGYLIPKSKLETFDDIYNIAKKAKTLDCYFKYELDRVSVYEIVKRTAVNITE